MGTLSNKHLGASTYKTPTFDEPAVIVAPVKSFLRRIATWLTKPICSIDFDKLTADQSDPGKLIRDSAEETSWRRHNPYDIYR